MALFETSALYVMPDKFPLLPGHTLIIPKAHLPCYAAAPIDLLDELDEAASRVRRFLQEMYGTPVLTTETGVAGQTVFHAHLHLVPMAMPEMPAEVVEHSDVTPIAGWQALKDYFAHHGRYYYVEFNSKRYVFTSYDSPSLQVVRRAAAERAGLTLGERGFVRTTTLQDVEAVGRRWREWTQDRN